MLVALLMIFFYISCNKDEKIEKNEAEYKLDDLISNAKLQTVNFNNALAGTTKTTTVDFDLGNNPYSSSDCSGSVFGSNPKIIDGVPIVRTHGKIIPYGDNNSSIRLPVVYDPGTGFRGGSGLALNYNFKRGCTYIIKINAFHSISSGTVFPKLLAQFTSQPSFKDCTVNEDPQVLFEGSSLPKFTLPPFGVDVSQTNQILFSPTSCFSHLWLSAIPPETYGKEWGGIILNWIQIIETQHLAVDGEPSVCGGSTQTYRPSYDNFALAESAFWSVTGDLEIIGSNIGNTVQVRATGPSGGNVEYLLDGTCSKITKFIQSSVPILSPDFYTVNGGSSRSLLTYNSVPNNPTNEVLSHVDASINISGATTTNVQLINQSEDNNVTWGASESNNKVMIYCDFIQPNQWAVFRVFATTSCGSSFVDVAFYNAEGEL